MLHSNASEYRKICKTRQGTFISMFCGYIPIFFFNYFQGNSSPFQTLSVTCNPGCLQNGTEIVIRILTLYQTTKFRNHSKLEAFADDKCYFFKGCKALILRIRSTMPSYLINGFKNYSSQRGRSYVFFMRIVNRLLNNLEF